MPPPGPGVGRCYFIGREGAYWRLLIRGAVLLAITLGIYRFWLSTDMRRFLWANTEIAGDTLEYTGTARELLLGFLIAIALLVPIYVLFFIASLSVLGQWSAVIGFLMLSWFGYFAIYRARRYRLTRTIYRGVRLHQEGAAWRYAFCAMFWGALSALTLGLAYPWGQASLERYKMRNTWYGDLPGHFAGSGTRLFLRGIWLWLAVLGPLIFSVVYAMLAIDWPALLEAFKAGGTNVAGRVESNNPNAAPAVVLLFISSFWLVTAAAVLYPAFQAIMLRWWMNGVRFGEMTATSRLRTGQMYGLYLRFVGISLLFGLVSSIIAGIVVAIVAITIGSGKTQAQELIGVAAVVVSYVIIMLGYSTIYQATVKLRTWRLSFEMLDLTGLKALDNVKARGTPSSAFGEGLADALNVGGI